MTLAGYLLIIIIALIGILIYRNFLRNSSMFDVADMLEDDSLLCLCLLVVIVTFVIQILCYYCGNNEFINHCISNNSSNIVEVTYIKNNFLFNKHLETKNINPDSIFYIENCKIVRERELNNLLDF